MRPSRSPSLNAFIPWTSVLPVLGVEVHGLGLPATVQCPLCHRQALGVHKEPARVGEWYHCSGCGFAGDAVELTAAAGDISTGSAILKLSTMGLAIPPELLAEPALDRHARKSGFRKRVRAFWDMARRSTHDSGETAEVQPRLGITPGMMHSPEWRRRGGRFVGCAHVRDAEELLHPSALNYRRSIGITGTGGVGWRPLFTGPGWRHVLVVAYHDVPGRVSGFLFIGRGGRWPEDFVFSQARTQQTGTSQAMGVAMFEAVLPHHREFGGKVLVVEDPVLALRIQLRHLAAADDPLPVVGAWGRSEKKSIWSTMPARDLVHWAPEPDGRLIARARKSGGKVATAPSGEAVTNHLKRSRPVVAVRAMFGAARPWDVALEGYLAQLAPAKAEELVLGLKMPPDEATGFLRGCAEDTRARLANLFAAAGRPRGVTVGWKHVTEAGGAWRVSGTGELVCDAILRIDQVIRSASGVASYRGRIEYRGHTVTFWAPDHEIEKDTLKWMRGVVGRAGLGEILIGGPAWSRYMLTLAQQFEPAESIRGLDVVGWDEARNGFALPRFVLRANGEVHAPDYVVPPEMPLPGANLAPPEGMTPGARAALAWGDSANELFWAVAACLLADILSPALGLPRSSTALVGPGAMGIGLATATAFGCRTIVAPARFYAAPSMSFLRELTGHRWPVFVRRDPGAARPEILHHILARLPAGIVVPASDWMGESLSLAGGWNVVACHEGATPGRIMEHGDVVLRSYLKDLCDRRLELTLAGSLFDAVHADLVAWYGQVGSSRPVVAARRHVRADDPAAHADRFGRLVGRLIASGALAMTSPGAGLRMAVTRLEGALIHIPKWGLNEALARRDAAALDIEATSARLRASGVLLGERDQDHIAGWIVSERWLDRHMGDYRRYALINHNRGT